MPLTAKFVRAHQITSNSNSIAWLMRLIYEFWGFCVNGGNELNTPHGFSNGTGYATMPAAFTSAGLLASGSDGFTAEGMPFFNTVGQELSGSFLGKWLVMWQSGSTCTDDSVYQIIQWENSSSVRLNTFTGGTPYSGTLHPSFTARSNINWRVVDFVPGTSLSYNLTSSLVLAFNDAGTVNPGQANSQAQFRMDSANSVVGITVSPSGSWQQISGTWQFTDPTVEIENSFNEGKWGGVYGNATGYTSLFAASDFIILHLMTNQNYASCGWHVEIPQRLYPAGDDPNPVAFMMWGETAPYQVDTNVNSYGGGFYVHNPPDGTTINYYTMGRRFFGDDTNTVGTATNGRYNGAYFNTYQNSFLFTDGILCMPVDAGQYQLARVRLRRVRFIAPIIPAYQRIGNNGEWIHVANGIMWPWDNTLLPYNLFLGGT